MPGYSDVAPRLFRRAGKVIGSPNAPLAINHYSVASEKFVRKFFADSGRNWAWGRVNYQSSITRRYAAASRTQPRFAPSRHARFRKGPADAFSPHLSCRYSVGLLARRRSRPD